MPEKQINQLYQFSYDYSHKKTLEEKKQALRNFQNLLQDHLANYDIVTTSIPLVRQYPALGDLKILLWLEKGLINRALNSGTGKVASEAYQIYTIGEEAAVLRNQNLQVLETERLTNGDSYYNVYLTKTLKNGEINPIYMNVSYIHQRLIIEKKMENPYYSYSLEP